MAESRVEAARRRAEERAGQQAEQMAPIGADEQAVNNELFLIDQNISILETKVANGDEFLDETEFQIEGYNIKLETYRDNIIANAYNLHTRNKISFAKYKEIENEINKTYSAAKLRHITDPMGKNLDLPAIIKVRKFLLDGKISEEEKIDLQKNGRFLRFYLKNGRFYVFTVLL